MLRSTRILWNVEYCLTFHSPKTRLNLKTLCEVCAADADTKNVTSITRFSYLHPRQKVQSGWALFVDSIAILDLFKCEAGSTNNRMGEVSI